MYWENVSMYMYMYKYIHIDVYEGVAGMLNPNPVEAAGAVYK
jgi:hypothetical protein